MSKFKIMIKVKIPKTKNGKPFIKEESELSDYNKDYLIFRSGGWYQSDNMGLYRDDNGEFSINSFYESDLELYEEKYTLQQLIDNKLAVICKTKGEALQLAVKIKPSNHSFDFYGSDNYVVLPSNNGTTYGFEWTNGESDLNYLVNKGYAIKNVNFSQIDFEEETKTNNNMKRTTFRLAKTEYNEAVKAILGHNNNVGEFQKGSKVYEKLQKAGVLDLWCEEVPDVMKIHGYEVKKHNGGYKIGCKFITFQQLQNLKDLMMGNNFETISLNPYTITIDEINKILAL